MRTRPRDHDAMNARVLQASRSLTFSILPRLSAGPIIFPCLPSAGPAKGASF